MKRALLITCIVASLLLTLYVGFSLGIYYHARFACAFTANQILRVRAMSVRGEDPQIIAREAADMARRWEGHGQGILLSAFNPKNIPQLVSLSDERTLLQRNQEVLGVAVADAHP